MSVLLPLPCSLPSPMAQACSAAAGYSSHLAILLNCSLSFFAARFQQEMDHFRCLGPSSLSQTSSSILLHAGLVSPIFKPVLLPCHQKLPAALYSLFIETVSSHRVICCREAGTWHCISLSRHLYITPAF